MHAQASRISPRRSCSISRRRFVRNRSAGSRKGAAVADRAAQASARRELSASPPAHTSDGSSTPSPATSDTRVSPAPRFSAGIIEQISSPVSTAAQQIAGSSAASVSGSRSAPSKQPTTSAAALSPAARPAALSAAASGEARISSSARIMRNIAPVSAAGRSARLPSARRRCIAPKPLSH